MDVLISTAKFMLFGPMLFGLVAAGVIGAVALVAISVEKLFGKKAAQATWSMLFVVVIGGWLLWSWASVNRDKDYGSSYEPTYEDCESGRYPTC